MELEIQKKELDDANQLKTNFLSNMSHELRTPLNSVIALSDVLNNRLAGKIADELYHYKKENCI
jgi:signal transduction histidine kinase